MRPDFGGGLIQRVFEPDGPELLATTSYLVQATLERTPRQPDQHRSRSRWRLATRSSSVTVSWTLLRTGAETSSPSRSGRGVPDDVRDGRHRTVHLPQRVPAAGAQGRRDAEHLNAIEYVEVRDTDEPTEALRQRTLYIRLIRKVPAPGSADELTRDNVSITGGDRIEVVDVEWVAPADATGAAIPAGVAAAGQIWSTTWTSRTTYWSCAPPCAVTSRRTCCRSSTPGRTSPRRLRPELSDGGTAVQGRVPDPTSTAATTTTCHDVPDRTGPRIDYLAKDFTGFRRVMLERLSQLSPSWSERNPPTSASRVVERWRTSPTSCPGGRTRSRPRPTSVPPAAACPCAGTPGSSTTASTRAAAHGSGCGSRPRRPTRTVPQGTVHVHPGADHGAATRRSHGRRAHPCAAPPARGVRDARIAGRRRRHCTRTQHPEFHDWGDPGACLPKGATAGTLRGNHPSCGRARCSCSPRPPTRRPVRRSTPTRLTGTRTPDRGRPGQRPRRRSLRGPRRPGPRPGHPDHLARRRTRCRPHGPVHARSGSPTAAGLGQHRPGRPRVHRRDRHPDRPAPDPDPRAADLRPAPPAPADADRTRPSAPVGAGHGRRGARPA